MSTPHTVSCTPTIVGIELSSHMPQQMFSWLYSLPELDRLVDDIIKNTHNGMGYYTTVHLIGHNIVWRVGIELPLASVQYLFS